MTRSRVILAAIRKVVFWSSDVPMDRTRDLETALTFVVRRIEEQAKESGHPLNEEEHSLLKILPPSNVNDLSWAATELGPAELVPRNINLERLCALAKAASLNDRQINPESLDWEFALAVFRVNRHPMWGVLSSDVPETFVGPTFSDSHCTAPDNCPDTPRGEGNAEHIRVGRNSLRNRYYHALNFLGFAAD